MPWQFLFSKTVDGLWKQWKKYKKISWPYPCWTQSKINCEVCLNNWDYLLSWGITYGVVNKILNSLKKSMPSLLTEKILSFLLLLNTKSLNSLPIKTYVSAKKRLYIKAKNYFCCCLHSISHVHSLLDWWCHKYCGTRVHLNYTTSVPYYLNSTKGKMRNWMKKLSNKDLKWVWCTSQFFMKNM